MRTTAAIISLTIAMTSACTTNSPDNYSFTTQNPNESQTQIQKARELIEYNLKDGESARYRNELIYKGIAINSKANHKVRTLYCGEINAKNSYGAYSGYRWASTFLETPHNPQISQNSQYFCGQYMPQKSITGQKSRNSD